MQPRHSLAGVRLDAATYRVTKTNDSEGGSLRQALLDANTDNQGTTGSGEGPPAPAT